ncbi:R3H domain-containing nucleic acid-binding protein [Tengunoibacter tsumagoiensis]|uniref:Single-stranded DNA-binding protein n=1 Tax=Tengunoibacter tsumagoiensis TaxID=2014871 RepID=A0A401ZUF4_9CHLR|nr:R3H domain-containing nucleic acid-binding protein [Tengunoibacter tsumagoiensis]GCE10511.1 single-stranded DNA-binding protein [Tengunoibacter tsumagoiensis]
MQHVITDDLEALLATLPPDIHDAVNRLDNRSELLEIVLDLGRTAEGRFPDGEVILSTTPVTYADLEYVVKRIGEFGDDNRAGIERTLHRISAMRNRKGRIVGLTCRIGRAVLGSIALIRDIVEQGQSILILGRPGVGKTTLLREIARVLADEANKRVVVVDTSNEIAGDGDIPHPGIGRARRMQVARTAEQHSVMIEAVENHMPQVIVIDEIGTELEAAAARTIAERGVQLVATAHGTSLGNLLVNPTLADLVGGIQTVTLGDEEARRRHTQKSILERKAPPTFDVVVEQQSWEEVTVHRDVADTVDNMLRGQPVISEERTRDEETGHVSVRRATSGGMDVPGWGAGLGGSNLAGRQGQGFTSSMFERERPERGGPNGGFGQFRQGPSQGGPRNPRGRNQTTAQVSPQVQALAPTGTSSAATAVLPAVRPVNEIQEGIYQAAEPVTDVSLKKTLRVYPFGVNRDRLAESARQLRVPVLVTNNEKEADAVITLKNYYRRQPERLQQAEQERKLIIILKNNSIMQMQHALARIFDIPEVPVSDEDAEESGAGIASEMAEFDDPTKQAMLETEDAIHQVLNKGLTTAELAPANAYIRRLQHQMATRYNLISRSRGKEPYRRVKIFRSRE